MVSSGIPGFVHATEPHSRCLLEPNESLPAYCPESVVFASAERTRLLAAVDNRGRNRVALARRRFQTFAIRDRHRAATTGDEARSLERGRHVADRRPRDAKHHGGKLLGEGKLFAAETILRRQDPARE